MRIKIVFVETKKFDDILNGQKRFVLNENNLTAGDIIRIVERNCRGETGRILDAKLVYVEICDILDFSISQFKEFENPPYIGVSSRLSCLNCIYSYIEDGEKRCITKDVIAETCCSFYQPRLVETCSNCSAPINKCVHKVEHWSTQGHVYPCCSKKCADSMDEKFLGVKTIEEIVDSMD